MNVVKTVLFWELSRRKMFTLWWTIGVSGLIAMTVLAYLAIGDQAKELNSAFDGLTSSAGTFFGSSDFFSPIGYLSSQIYYILLPLLLIIMVLTLVSSLVSKDENDTTVELTLARPISRNTLLLSKAIAGLIIFAAVCAVSYGVTVACVKIAGLDINQSDLLLTHLLSFAFSASFGAISFMLIVASRLTRRIGGIVAIILSFGGYIVASLSGFVMQLEGLSKVMPYHYYNTIDLLSGKVDKGLVVYLVGVLVVCAVVSGVLYRRRDIG